MRCRHPSFNAYGTGWTSADYRIFTQFGVVPWSFCFGCWAFDLRQGESTYGIDVCHPASCLRRRYRSRQAVSARSTGTARTRIRCRAAREEASHRIHGRLSGNPVPALRPIRSLGERIPVAAMRIRRLRPDMTFPDFPRPKGRLGRDRPDPCAGRRSNGRGNALPPFDATLRPAGRNGKGPGSTDRGRASREALQAPPLPRPRPTPCGRSRRPAERLWRGLGRCGGAPSPRRGYNA